MNNEQENRALDRFNRLKEIIGQGLAVSMRVESTLDALRLEVATGFAEVKRKIDGINDIRLHVGVKVLVDTGYPHRITNVYSEGTVLDIAKTSGHVKVSTGPDSHDTKWYANAAIVSVLD